MKLNYRDKLDKTPESFEELLQSDRFGLLDNLGEKKLSMSVSDKIKASFEEVAEFVKKNNRLPSPESEDFDEELLAIKFNTLIKDAPEGKVYCESFLQENKDKNILEGMHIFQKNDSIFDKKIQEYVEDLEMKSYENIDDIFNNDPFGLLKDVGDTAIENESWNKKRDTPSNSVDGKTAKTTVCKDFFKYEKYFNEINRLLAEGHLVDIPIQGERASIELADIFIVNGVMSIIADVYDSKFRIESSRKLTYRVKQIFINGKESCPLSTSIKTSFYTGGDIPCKRIIRNDRITEQSNLVKIGYCTTDVATRIANAKNEPTYLCAPVNVLKTYTCYNFDPQNLEDILHTILDSHRLNVEIKDINGNVYRPQEWFTVSVQTASEIVDHLFSGDITDYYVDKIQGKLKKKVS